MKIATLIKVGLISRRMIFQSASSIVSKEKLSHKIFRLTLSSPLIAQRAKPGNFVHLRVTPNHYPLLRRAFSIHNIDKQKGSFEVLFKVVGKGTEILSEKSPGDMLDLLGPIGNNFSRPQKGETVMLVAGGMGIAPYGFSSHI
jgi:dihydroorotate dehydrogenase electron transfer subunit